MPFDKLENVTEVLDMFRAMDALHEELWWRTDGDYAPVTFLVDCSDLFMWGVADCEEITEENLPRLRATYEEIKERFGDDSDEISFFPHLFCARERQMRPQYAYYKQFPETMKELFNAVSDKPGYNAPTSVLNSFVSGIAN